MSAFARNNTSCTYMYTLPLKKPRGVTIIDKSGHSTIVDLLPLKSKVAVPAFASPASPVKL